MSGKAKKIWNIVSTVLVVIVVLFAILLVGVRLFGIQVYSVISGSMEPEYPVGSLIYVKDVDPSQIRVNDVITYVLPNDMPSTHRVIGIDKQNQLFYTKGDANKTEDGAPVHFRNLIGKPVFTIPLLGYVAHFIQHPPGMYVAIAIGAILLIIVFIPDLFKKNDGKPKALKEPDGPKEPDASVKEVEQTEPEQTEKTEPEREDEQIAE
ncbi:MAG: signal peptidase I [Clostridia bacterium]|nr:signal peptidase I [Clostridia bacterium]MBQ5837265.1 signal peptidase I [Clostridia bacterium]